MIWKPIQIGDRGYFEKWFLKKGYPISDYNFTHLNIWKKAFQYEYVIIEDFLVIGGTDPLSHMSYILMPLGDGDIEPVIRCLLDYFDEKNSPLTISAVTANMKSDLEGRLNLAFEYHLERNDFEYIYETQKIASYTSKKLKRKKEQCHSFERHYPYTLREYKGEDYQGVMSLIKGWYDQYAESGDPIIAGELEGIDCILRHYEDFSCTGFVFSVQDKVIGFSLAEQLTEDILLIHFEKGDRNYKGIYDVMKRDLSKYFERIKYLSLEEDMGIRGLRTAKKMYEPAHMIEKGTLHFIKHTGRD